MYLQLKFLNYADSYSWTVSFQLLYGKSLREDSYFLLKLLSNPRLLCWKLLVSWWMHSIDGFVNYWEFFLIFTQHSLILSLSLCGNWTKRPFYLVLPASLDQYIWVHWHLNPDVLSCHALISVVRSLDKGATIFPLNYSPEHIPVVPDREFRKKHQGFKPCGGKNVWTSSRLAGSCGSTISPWNDLIGWQASTLVVHPVPMCSLCCPCAMTMGPGNLIYIL